VEVLDGRYRLVERLGTGGMSVVWRGFDEVLRRPVAVKVLASSYVADEASRERIRDEAHAAAVLSHPNITGVYDYGESEQPDGTVVPYVVMELVHGRSLLRHLADGPLPWRAALRVCAQVATALAAAHARGLVHRDIKPANVMLTPAGAKVVDFGIAAIAGEAGDVTPDGMLFGTPAYLAPERLDGQPVEPASDVYALGVLLYRTLTGGLPWNASSTAEVVTAHRSVRPKALPAIEGMPAAVSELYLRCLAKDPADRPTSREVARTLAAAASVDAQPATPLTVVEGPYPLEAGDGHDVYDVVEVLDAELDSESSLDELGLDVEPAGSDTALVPRNSAAPAVTRRSNRRRALARAGAAGGVLVVLALGVVTCSAMSGGSSGPPAAAAPGRTTTPAPTSRQACMVRYQTRNDGSGAFAVDITVGNSGPDPVAHWALSMTFPGDQQVSGVGSVGVAQTGTHVVFNGGGDLRPGQEVSFSFTGRYTGTNPLPTVFSLNEVICSYVLIGATGATIAAGGPPAAPVMVGADGGGGPLAPGGETTTDSGAGGGPVVPPQPATDNPNPAPDQPAHRPSTLPTPDAHPTKSRKNGN
jgi:serine/threonine-protein kinase